MIGLWLSTAKIELLVVIFLDTFYSLLFVIFFVFVSTIWLDIGQCGVLLGLIINFYHILGHPGTLVPFTMQI